MILVPIGEAAAGGTGQGYKRGKLDRAGNGYCLREIRRMSTGRPWGEDHMAWGRVGDGWRGENGRGGGAGGSRSSSIEGEGEKKLIETFIGKSGCV